MERNVLGALRFRLVTDTLYYWLDLGVRLWDLFAEREFSNKCLVYKPKET